MMEIRKLSKEEIRIIYEERMVSDFPKAELKPFSKLAEMYDRGQYSGYSVVGSQGELLSYALFARLPAEQSGRFHYLFDYFAVHEDLRNEGIGTKFLRRLATCLPDAESVIGEVENPRFSKDEAEEELRSRRLRFYHRNRVRACGVTASVLGVSFQIVEALLGKPHSAEEIREVLQRFYRLFFTEEEYEKWVEIR